jgi:hypothetical protein
VTPNFITCSFAETIRETNRARGDARLKTVILTQSAVIHHTCETAHELLFDLLRALPLARVAARSGHRDAGAHI